jgi:predicted Zn-dependent protease
LALLARAEVLDPRARFSPEREKYYRLQGDLHGLAGGVQQQLICYGLASLCRKDYSAAAQYSQRSLKEGDAGPAQLLEAELQYAMGQKDAAKNILGTLTQFTSASAEAHELLSRIYVENQDIPAAVAEIRQAIAKREFDVDLRKSLAHLLVRLDKAQEALQMLKDGLLVGGANDGNYLHIYGELLRLQHNAKESVVVLEKALKVEPNNGDLFLSLARAHEAAGNKRKAAEALLRAVTLKPELQKEILKP